MSLHFHRMPLEAASAVGKLGNKARWVSASRSGTPSILASDDLEGQDTLWSLHTTHPGSLCYSFLQLPFMCELTITGSIQTKHR